MNYDKIKQLVIKKKWHAAKSGDKYRSLVKQIENFCIRLREGDTFLQWLPLEFMSDDEIALFIDNYLDRSKANRLMLNNVGFKGIKYDYTELIVEVPEKVHSQKMIEKVTPALKNFKKLKIREVVPTFRKIIRNSCCTDCKKIVIELERYNRSILAQIQDEKGLVFLMGINFTNPNYFNQYISVIDTMAIEVIFKFILKNDNISNKLSALTIIEKNLDVLSDDIDDAVEKARQQFYFSRENCEFDKNNIDMISMYYVQYLQARAYYDEQEKIYGVLQKEILDYPKLFNKPMIFEHKVDIDMYKNKNLKQILTEGICVAEFTRKKYESQQLIDKNSFEVHQFWSSRDILALKTVFRECFMSKTKYQSMGAMRIVRDILQDKNVSVQQALFINLKIIRGYFREWDMIPEFRVYCRICIKLHKILLKTYGTLDDIEAYKIIYRIGYDFLYTFYFGELSGLIEG